MGCPHTESEGGYSDTSRRVAEVLENWRVIQWILVFRGGSVVKNLPANAGNAGSIPGLGRSPGEGNGKPLQYPCLENSMDRGAWQAAVHGVTKSNDWTINTFTCLYWTELHTTEHTHTHTHILALTVNYFDITASDNLYKMQGVKNVLYREFPVGTVVRTPCFHCHRPTLNSSLGN